MLIPNFDLYKTEWLDLVFDKRNKNYGAYELRSHYAATMTKAISIAVISVVGAALAFGIATKRQQIAITTSMQDTTTVHIRDINHILKPKPKLPDVKPPMAAPKVNTVVIPTHVTTHEETAIDPPTQTQLNTSVIGTQNAKGEAAPANIPITPVGSGSTISDVTPAGTGTEILDFAEISPEPNGGMAAWSKFLQKNLRYPDTEMQGRVLISFVVERDGSLTDIKLVRGVDSQLDNEALRVLKTAPKWKPGMQAGKPVRVQFTLPINFQLNN